MRGAIIESGVGGKKAIGSGDCMGVEESIHYCEGGNIHFLTFAKGFVVADQFLPAITSKLDFEIVLKKWKEVHKV